MNDQSQRRHWSGESARRGARKRWRVAAIGLAASQAAVQAQDVIAPPPAYITPPAVLESQSEMGLPPPVATGPGIGQNAPLVQWGQISLRPHPDYRFLYGDGIPAAPGQDLKTVIQEFSPGFLIGLGTHWSLDYTPTERLYSNRNFQDSLDQNVRLTGGVSYEGWMVGFSQSYSKTSQPLIETGVQTEQEIYATDLNASYNLNSRMLLETDVSQSLGFSQGFGNTRTWSTLDWLTLKLVPRLDFSVGTGGGYTSFSGLSGAPTTANEQLQARINWRPTDRITFEVNGGAEDEQFLTGGASDLINPVFGLTLDYRPFETTTLSLGANRTVGTSIQGPATETTGFNGTVSQRLLKRLYLTLQGGYNSTSYLSITDSSASIRNDDGFTFMARLSCVFLKHGTAAIFFQETSNSSSLQQYTLTSNQVGFQLGWQY